MLSVKEDFFFFFSFFNFHNGGAEVHFLLSKIYQDAIRNSRLSFAFSKKVIIYIYIYIYVCMYDINHLLVELEVFNSVMVSSRQCMLLS
jgi:hypothetical protein